MVSWLAAHCSKSAVQDLMRIAWRSVGRIVTRVVADAQRGQDPFRNLKIRLITRVAFGFHSPMALIALATLSLGDYCPALPNA